MKRLRKCSRALHLNGLFQAHFRRQALRARQPKFRPCTLNYWANPDLKERVYLLEDELAVRPSNI